MRKTNKQTPIYLLKWATPNVMIDEKFFVQSIGYLMHQKHQNFCPKFPPIHLSVCLSLAVLSIKIRTKTFHPVITSCPHNFQRPSIKSILWSLCLSKLNILSISRTLCTFNVVFWIVSFTLLCKPHSKMFANKFDESFELRLGKSFRAKESIKRKRLPGIIFYEKGYFSFNRLTIFWRVIFDDK